MHTTCMLNIPPDWCTTFVLLTEMSANLAGINGKSIVICTINAVRVDAELLFSY